MPVPEGRPPLRGRLAILTFAVFFLTVSSLLIATGGFQTAVLGVRVSARSPVAAGVVAAVLCVAWLVSAWRARALASDLTRVSAWIDAHAGAIVAVIAALAGAGAVAFGTFSAAGSDASGYLSQAARGVTCREKKI